MPLYTYYCPTHGNQEQVQKYAERDKATCRDCDNLIQRQGVEKPSSFNAPAYQMGVFTGKGQVIKGHFGKEAKRRQKGE